MNRWNIFAARESEDQPSEEDDPPSDSSESPPTLAERREAARPLRAVTRTASSSSSRSGRLTAQQTFQNHLRSRTPSPNPPTTPSSTASAFPKATTSTMSLDEAQMQRMIAAAVKLALQEDRADRDRQSAAHTEAAVAAALNNQTQHVRSLRKPDLPPLDKKNIESWILRVEYAYTRAEVTRTKDKLAFLESKFTGCDDAKINELLQGTTDDHWTQLLDYLRDIHGRTTEDKVNSLLHGFPRESRRPQQLASHIRERVGNITLDDVLKETLLKEIPPEVRQHAATTIKDLDFQRTADHLEIYFDKQGRVLNSSRPSTSINAVNSKPQQQKRTPRPLQSAIKSETPSGNASASPSRSSEVNDFTAAFDDAADTDVNAVRFKPNGQRQSFNVANRSQSRGRIQNGGQQHNDRKPTPNRYPSSNPASSSNNSSSNTQRRPPTQTPNHKVCFYHETYGQKARSCEEGCLLWSSHQQAKGQANH